MVESIESGAVRYRRMLTVNVPDEAKFRLVLLAVVSDQIFDEISIALNKASPNLRQEKFTEQFKSAASGISAEIAELLDVIIHLSRSYRDASVSVEELASGVASIVSAPEKYKEAFDPKTLERRLLALLSIQSLKLYARASDVQAQYEDLFFGARIMSDIRTVFEPDGTNPLGAMIVHSLKITHGKAGQYPKDDKFFALDPTWKSDDFFTAKTIEQLLAEQGISPIADVSIFSGVIPDEDIDEFVADIYRGRAA